MAEITATMVKELRDRTGAGMMDCKKALNETAGDFEAAIDWLRAKGLASAAKKAGRTAAEGLVGVVVAGNRGAVVEVNSETDFVAKNAQFQDFVRIVTDIAVAQGTDVAALLAASYPESDGSVHDRLTHNIATIGENQSLRRAGIVEVAQGVVTSYIHNATVSGLGKIGVLVALESPGDVSRLTDLGRKVAMHIASMKPLAATTAELDPATVEKERQILTAQAAESGKPANVIEKMVEGRIRKFYQESVLVEQAFVMDPDVTVGKFIENAGKNMGAPVKLKGFLKFEVGEGIEKAANDFAAEVASFSQPKQ